VLFQENDKNPERSGAYSIHKYCSVRKLISQPNLQLPTDPPSA
jgi:hypothetical protein